MAASPITPRLLVVENDPGLRVLLAALLTDEGYTVVSASSLPQALALTEVQVFHGIFTTLFPQDQEDPLRSVGSLRAQTWPTPIVVLSRDDVSEAEARRRGFVTVLELPFRIEDVLQVLARQINRPFSPVHAGQVSLITRYLDALGRGEWEVVRSLCLPTMSYASCTASLFGHPTRIEGVNAYLAFARGSQAQLSSYRLEQQVVFEVRSQLVTRFGSSWQGREGQRVSLVGSIAWQCAGERIARIRVAQSRQRLRTLLANTAPE